MKKENLFKQAAALGFPLFKTEEDQNANLTLADMVKSMDLRLWEGFPVVLATSAEKAIFNYDKVKWYLKKPFDKHYLASLVLMSLALYKFLNLKFLWADKLYNSFSNDGKKEFAEFLTKFKKESDFKVAGHSMSGQRVKSAFTQYFNKSQPNLSDLMSAKDELGLEYALSQVFSPKQKELFLKKLKCEKLTKTEKEYFSRVVKKKVLAFANAELHRLSQKVLSF